MQTDSLRCPILAQLPFWQRHASRIQKFIPCWHGKCEQSQSTIEDALARMEIKRDGLRIIPQAM
jgi:hypothetical protein